MKLVTDGKLWTIRRGGFWNREYFYLVGADESLHGLTFSWVKDKKHATWFSKWLIAEMCLRRITE
jgi:hypothetical protein